MISLLFLVFSFLFLSQSAIDDSEMKQQMNIVESGVNYNIKRYNDLKVLNERLVAELKVRLDELDDQKNSYEELNAMKNVSITKQSVCSLYESTIL